MSLSKILSPLLKFAQKILIQSLIGLPVSIFIGFVIALFLWLLDKVTLFRFQYPYLLYFLPLAGLFIHVLYAQFGKSSERGNNLVLEEIHDMKKGIPWIMSPLILVTTLITHLFGGSAGREGTAVQIGASLASTWGSWLQLNPENFRAILIAGMAGGFGAVFGTPWAGAIFAVEVLVIGRIDFKGFLPALFSAFLSHRLVLALGIHHTQYTIQANLPINIELPFKIILASIAFGMASQVFSGFIHNLKNFLLKRIYPVWLIPILGGIILIGLRWIFGNSDYLGLGVLKEFTNSKTILSAFKDKDISPLAWLWKTLFTGITLGTGFKGGEVTPLFYIGASLGNALAIVLKAPLSLFAGLGFIGVFAGATKTPLASSILGIELFGPQYGLFFFLCCFTASYFSGKTGIYSSQKRISDFR